MCTLIYIWGQGVNVSGDDFSSLGTRTLLSKMAHICLLMFIFQWVVTTSLNVADWCYNPSGNDCSWYKECLAVRIYKFDFCNIGAILSYVILNIGCFNSTILPYRNISSFLNFIIEERQMWMFQKMKDEIKCVFSFSAFSL